MNPYWLFLKVLLAVVIIGVGYALYRADGLLPVLLILIGDCVIIGAILGLYRIFAAGMAWDRNNQGK